jgi:hypothetical protein
MTPYSYYDMFAAPVDSGETETSTQERTTPTSETSISFEKMETEKLADVGDYQNHQ